MVLLELWREVWLYLKLLGGTQGASRLAPGKSIILLSYEGELGIALESRQGNRASRCVEGGISRSSPVAAGNSGFPRLVMVT